VRKSEYARLSGQDRRFIKGQKYTLLAHRENLTLEGRKSLLTGVNCFFRSATIISAGGQSFRFRVLGGSDLPARPEISAPARSLKAI
jgi:hypothetical protein